MFSTTMFLLALLGAATAQSTVDLIIPLLDSQELVGEVIGVQATATTYVLQCANATATDCAVGGPFTFIEGPSTVSFVITEAATDGNMTATVACSLTGSPATTGTCTQTLVSAYNDDGGVTTLPINSTDITYYPVLITATNTNGGPATQLSNTITSSGASAGMTGTTSGSGSTASGSTVVMSGSSSTATGSASSTSASAKSSAEKTTAGPFVGLLAALVMGIGML